MMDDREAKQAAWFVGRIFIAATALMALFAGCADAVNPPTTRAGCTDALSRYEYIMPAYRIGCWLGSKP